MRIGLLGSLLVVFPAVCLAAPKWELLNTGMGAVKYQAVAVNKQDSAHVIAGSDQSIFESRDGGSTWHQRFRLPGTSRTTTLHIFQNVILVGSSEGLFIGSDNELQAVRAVRATCRSFLEFSSEIVYAATNDGLYMSKDSAVSWTEVSIPRAARDVLGLATAGHGSGQLFLLTTGGLYESGPQAGAWSKVRNVRFAGGPEVEEPDVVAVSETAEEPDLLHPLGAIAVDPTDSSVYLGGVAGLMRRTNQGGHWHPIPRMGMGAHDVQRLLVQAHSPVMIYVATSAGVTRLNPTTQRWTALNTGLTTRRINDLAGSPQALWAATDDGLYRYEIAPPDASDDGSPTPQELLANFTHEPTITQVRDSAIAYAEVHPEKIRRWRRQAALKALLPSIDFGFDRNQSNDVGVDEGTFPNFQFIETEDRDANWDMSVSWDLSELIWNQDQTSIDVRSKLMVELRDDIVDEVTRTYFERRRLQIELMTEPPETQKAQLAKELRVQELTALLDGLTGGYFSRYSRVPVDSN